MYSAECFREKKETCVMKMKVLLRATDLRNENVLPLTKTREKIYFVLKYHKNLVTGVFYPFT